MTVRGDTKVKFKDGTLVKSMSESKYLGCFLNNKTDPDRELNKRKADVYVTWKRLEEFWKNSNCDFRFKLIVYDAVIRAKLMYGLESLQLNKDKLESINAFQRKGLRQILKMLTTHGQHVLGKARSNTNELLYQLTNAKVNMWGARKAGEFTWRDTKQIIPLSEFVV